MASDRCSLATGGKSHAFSLDFRGFDSGRFFMLGGRSYQIRMEFRMEFPGSLESTILGLRTLSLRRQRASV